MAGNISITEAQSVIRTTARLNATTHPSPIHSRIAEPSVDGRGKMQQAPFAPLLSTLVAQVVPVT
jgi:hypothetical protein